MTLSDFFYMGGYGGYVWSAYGSVLTFLAVQWFITHYRWKKLLRDITAHE